MNDDIDRQPFISVVTVVRNGKEVMERTIRSVLDQRYENIEYIVIDGGSNDGTVDTIRKYDGRIACWISEPDRGIFDAMNKGIDRVHGEWVLFLNAGDRFADGETIGRLVRCISGETDVLYGSHEEDFGDGYVAMRPAGRLEDLWKGMIFSHQAMLVKTSLMRTYRFNIESPITADYEFIHVLYQQGLRFRRTPLVIARVLSDGFSAVRNVRLTLDQWQVARRFRGRSLKLDLYHLQKLLCVYNKNILKRLLPRKIAAYLRSR